MESNYWIKRIRLQNQKENENRTRYNSIGVMSKLAQIKFQWYSGNIKDTKPRGFISLEDFIIKHQNPTENILEVFDKIEEASSKGDKQLKAQLKTENLFYFTPGAIFNNKRRYSEINHLTGLAQIDIDGLEQEEALDLKEYLFDSYKHFFCVYVSPSRNGVKGLMRIPVGKDVAEFKEYYQGIENELNWIAGFDSAPKNLALPLFLSYDTDILWREDAEIWTEKGVVEDINSEKRNLNIEKPIYNVVGDAIVFQSQAYFRRITLDIFERKLNEINDNGHPQLRSACLVLGSRVGAGYLDQSDAEGVAEYHIKTNSYLSKGISGYVTTMKWCIRKGIGNPRYYK